MNRSGGHKRIHPIVWQNGLSVQHYIFKVFKDVSRNHLKLYTTILDPYIGVPVEIIDTLSAIPPPFRKQICFWPAGV